MRKHKCHMSSMRSPRLTRRNTQPRPGLRLAVRLCRGPLHRPLPSPGRLEPQLPLSRTLSNLLYFQEFAIPTGRIRCHGDVSLRTPRPAQEAKFVRGSPARPPWLRGGCSGPALP